MGIVAYPLSFCQRPPHDDSGPHLIAAWHDAGKRASAAAGAWDDGRRCAATSSMRPSGTANGDPLLSTCPSMRAETHLDRAKRDLRDAEPHIQNANRDLEDARESAFKDLVARAGVYFKGST